jgi:hypothetical protein
MRKEQMAEDASLERTGRRRYEIAAFLLAAVVLAIAFHRPSYERGDVTVVRGHTRIVNHDRTAIFFDGERVSGPRFRTFKIDSGFRVAGAMWDDGRSWHDNEPPGCLEPGTRRQEIEMGLLEANPTDDALGSVVVVWLECLEGSTRR